MKKVSEFWNDRSKTSFIAAIITMIIAHGFCFLNLMYSHDSLNFWETTGVSKVALGRWLYPTIVQMRGVATPWMIGIISIVYVALAVVLVVKIFDFNKIQGICVAVIFSTSITLTALFCTYIFDADADCLAILLACLSVYIIEKFPKGFNVIASSVALTLCLALYQAYICVALGLFVLLIVYKSKDIKNWKDVWNVFLMGVWELVTILIGALTYVKSMHIMADHYGVELSTSYNGPGNLSTLTVGAVLDGIPKAYTYFKDTFLSIDAYNTVGMKNAYVIILLLSIVSMIIYIVNNRLFVGGGSTNRGMCFDYATCTECNLSRIIWNDAQADDICLWNNNAIAICNFK